ncbi:MAG: hypothetical protein ABEJ23_07555 [Haloarculaceae archaeon]
MDVERETVVEVVASIIAVGLFVAVIVGIGVAYSGGADFTDQGALALVVAIAGFVLAMAGVGYFLAGR